MSNEILKFQTEAKPLTAQGVAEQVKFLGEIANILIEQGAVKFDFQFVTEPDNTFSVSIHAERKANEPNTEKSES